MATGPARPQPNWFEMTNRFKMMRMRTQGLRRSLYTATWVLFFLVVTAAPAGALLGLEFDPGAAPPGAEIRVTTVGPVFANVSEDGYDLYLAPSQRIADRVTGPGGRPRHPSLVAIGRIEADASGVGHLRFTVPRLEPGRYVVVAHCKTCDLEGTTFSAVGPVRITSGASLPETGGVPPIVWFAGTLCGLGLILLVTRRPGTPRA